MKHVRYNVRDAVAVVSLSRPERRNALGEQMREDLAVAFANVGLDERVRVVVLTGEGSAFCAGGDLQEMLAAAAAGRTRSAAEKADPPRDRTLLSVHRCVKPVIAAINGPALGAGMSLALAADIRIASSTAVFAQTFVKRGNVPDYGSTYLLPRIVGLSKAMELMLTGQTIDAQQALLLQLVSKVVSPEHLLEAALGLAAEIAQNAPVALRLTKRIVQGNLGSIQDALEREVMGQNICLDVNGDLEGFRAYGEKRLPAFEGR